MGPPESDRAPRGRLFLLRHRRMQLRDIPECVRIVAAHPVLGPRYGDAINDLAGAWRSLLNAVWSVDTAVFEETEGARTKIHGVGISVFVTNDFFREAKTPPFFWLGPELTRRIGRGRSPLLTEKQVREANTSEGLNIVVWQCGISPETMARPDIGELCVKSFIEDHSGFRLKEVICQGETPEQYLGMFNSGAFLYDPIRRIYGGGAHLDPVQALTELHLVGLDREAATRQIGSWFGTLFNYRPPLLGFNGSEQRLLCASLDGRTDQALSDALGISLFAVKKSWRAIYARVTDRLPELLPNPLSDDPSARDRGMEKKRVLVAYLREHPEELRPVSRKLLRLADSQRRLPPGPKSAFDADV